MDLNLLLEKFKLGFIQADKVVKEQFVWKNKRTGKEVNLGYGITPHVESKVVKWILDNESYFEGVESEVNYPGKFSKEKADFIINDIAVEVKIIRQMGAVNKKLGDTWIKQLLSPIEEHRSSITDIKKLKEGFGNGIILIVVYDYVNDQTMKPDDIREMWERIATMNYRIKAKAEIQFELPVSNFHKKGNIYAWKI